MKQNSLVLILILCMLFTLSGCGSSSGESSTGAETEREATTTTEQMKPESTTEVAKTTQETEQETIVETTKAKEKSKAKEKTTEAVKETEDDNPYHKITELDGSYQREFGHASNESVYLGTEESMTFKVEATGKKLGEDDLLVFDSKEILSIKLKDVDSTASSATFTYTIKGKKPGSTTFFVISKYNVYNDNYENGIELDMRILDKTEGKTVFYTETGERYHYSEACAGESSRPTTLYDAEMVGLTPCGNCAN